MNPKRNMNPKRSKKLTPKAAARNAHAELTQQNASTLTCGRYGPLMEGNVGTVFRWL